MFVSKERERKCEELGSGEGQRLGDGDDLGRAARRETVTRIYCLKTSIKKLAMAAHPYNSSPEEVELAGSLELASQPHLSSKAQVPGRDIVSKNKVANS